MKYRFDIKFTGYEEVTVEADSLKEAEDLAIVKFESLYKKSPAFDLRTVSIELDQLGGPTR